MTDKVIRYKVIHCITGKILCNVPEFIRARNICNAYPNTWVVNSFGEVIYSNVTTL